MLKRIAQITDLHLDEAFQVQNRIDTRSNLARVLKDLKSREVALLVCTGDMGLSSSYGWLMEQLRNTEIPFNILLGNHDSYADFAPFWKPRNPASDTELYYADEDDHFKYLYMDTSTCRISEAQLAWIQSEIQTQKELIVLSHHPLLPTGTTPQREHPLAGDKQVQSLLEQHKLPVHIFCGHLHMNHRVQNQQMVQYNSPAVCVQVAKYSETTEMVSKDFGCRLIELYEGRVETEVLMFKP